MTQTDYKLLRAYPSSKLMQKQQFLYATLFLNTGHCSGKIVRCWTAMEKLIYNEAKFDGFSRVLIRTCQRNILYLNTKTPI
jgi:hypothetical protein